MGGFGVRSIEPDHSLPAASGDGSTARHVGLLLVGAYAWIETVLFGAILLDVVRATQVPDARMGEVRDALLGIGVLALLTGLGAVAAWWQTRTVSALLLASLALLSVEFLAPALLSQAVRDVEAASGFRIGPWIRLGVSGSASVLAFVGWWVASRRLGRDAAGTTRPSA
jgi:hypothetical protein